MTPNTILLITFAIIAGAFAIYTFANYVPGVGMFSTIWLVLCLVLIYDETSESGAERKANNRIEKQAIDLELKTPKVISEVDGCKVYRFISDGRARFFTRCPTGVSEVTSEDKL